MVLQEIPLFISTEEIAFILFIVVMVFGADKLPEIARGLGKGMRSIKETTNDIKNEITKSAEQSDIDTSFVTDIKKEIDSVKDDIDDLTGSVKRSL